MKLKHLFSVIFLVLISFFGYTQDCVLGIGGKDYETIVSVFQLNEEQIQKLEGWRAELEIEKKLINEEAVQLFETHPQSTPEELMILGQKYNVLKDKLLNATLKYDRKLITAFNEKQHERYLSLCTEASRMPLIVETK